MATGRKHEHQVTHGDSHGVHIHIWNKNKIMENQNRQVKNDCQSFNNIHTAFLDFSKESTPYIVCGYRKVGKCCR